MTDEELIDTLRSRSTEALFKGAILEHCWLGYPATEMTEHAGSWQVRISVEELEHLLDIVDARMWWRRGDTLDY